MLCVLRPKIHDESLFLLASVLHPLAGNFGCEKIHSTGITALVRTFARGTNAVVVILSVRAVEGCAVQHGLRSSPDQIVISKKIATA